MEGLCRGSPFVWAEIRELLIFVSFTRKQRTFVTCNPLISICLETKRCLVNHESFSVILLAQCLVPCNLKDFSQPSSLLRFHNNGPSKSIKSFSKTVLTPSTWKSNSTEAGRKVVLSGKSQDFFFHKFKAYGLRKLLCAHTLSKERDSQISPKD